MTINRKEFEDLEKEGHPVKAQNHHFVRWTNGPWANSFICKWCNLTAYSQPAGWFTTESEPRADVPSCSGLN